MGTRQPCVLLLLGLLPGMPACALPVYADIGIEGLSASHQRGADTAGGAADLSAFDVSVTFSLGLFHAVGSTVGFVGWGYDSTDVDDGVVAPVNASQNMLRLAAHVPVSLQGGDDDGTSEQVEHGVYAPIAVGLGEGRVSTTVPGAGEPSSSSFAVNLYVGVGYGFTKRSDDDFSNHFAASAGVTVRRNTSDTLGDVEAIGAGVHFTLDLLFLGTK